MKPAAFDYFAPETVEEALERLAGYGGDGEARPLAGGQSLVPTMNFRLARPGALVDLNRVRELSFVRVTEEGPVRVGAMTRQRELERSPAVADRVPLLGEVMPHVGHPQIRNRGTVGGSLAHADPAAELPAALLALEGRCRIRGREGDRWVEAGDFFRGLFGTALEPGELLVAVEFPVSPPRTGWAFEEFSRRRGDFALAGVAAGVTVDGEGRCERVRLAYLGLGPGPVSGEAGAAVLVDEAPSEEAFRAAAATAAREDIDPPGDVHAGPEYRRHLSEVLTRRALARAVARAGADRPSGEESRGPA